MSQSRKDFLLKAGLGALSLVPGLSIHIEGKAHPTIRPRGLSEGDTIGMISPASSLDSDEEYDNVATQVESLGFKVKVGVNARSHYGYLAGTDRQRAADLNAMFADSMVDAILPFRGGWGSNRILEYLNFDLIQSHPKPLIGYSDITALLLAIYERTGIITFHGPVGKSTWSDFTLSYFKKALMQDEPFKMSNSDDTDVTTISEGEAEGVLLGGNLSVLSSMLGSEYVPDWRNSILFLEDVGEDIYRIDRMLTQLRLNGVFKKINGLIFGKCTACDVSDGYHFTLEQIVRDHIKEFEIPAYIGANIGHIDDMFTLPIGIPVSMNSSNGIITLLEPPVTMDR